MTTQRKYLIALLGLVIVAVGAIVIAEDTKPSEIGGTGPVKTVADLPIITKGPPPSLAAGKGWLNSKPLTAADLKGKVVVYDFWTYSCINCVRTLPYVESWANRYAKDGLVVVGVHSPEFDFEKVHKNVSAAVKKLGVTYPVVYDDDMAIWQEFNNQYWPAKYITDRSGNLRYQHFGEGEYNETENILRLLLGVKKDAPRAIDPKMKQESLTAAVTPETYVGYERGGNASPEKFEIGTHDYTIPRTLDPNRYAVDGTWSVQGEYVETTDATENLDLRYKGGEVNLVMDRTGADTAAVIELDGKPVPKDYWGTSIVEQDGQTVINVDSADLYHLIDNGPEGLHTLRVHPLGAGVQAYAYTFGS